MASDSVDEPSSLLILGEGDDDDNDHGESDLGVDAVMDVDDQDIAEEITETEAAQRLGRKRPRRSLPAPSPELGSGRVDQIQPEAEPEPLAKRRRTKKVPDSPAAQQQPGHYREQAEAHDHRQAQANQSCLVALLGREFVRENCYENQIIDTEYDFQYDQCEQADPNIWVE